MFTRAIVRPPAPNFSQGLTTAGLGAPDYERALEQHQAYCAALEQCGLTLTKLDANPDYPDSTFVEDTAVLVEVPDGDQTRTARQQKVESQAHPHSRATAPVNERHAILTKPGASSRGGEVVSIRKVLSESFPALLSIQSPGTLDGGDVCQAENHFFIGISERTNEAGAQQLAELLAPHRCTSSFVDIRSPGEMKSAPGAVATGLASPKILHLKSGLSYLGENRLVIIDELAGRPEFSPNDLIRIGSREEYAANCIRVNDHVLVAAGYPAFENMLREMGYRTIALDMSEFQKMDGGLSCLSLRF